MITSLTYIVVTFYFFNRYGLINGIDLIKDYIKLILFGLFPMIYTVATKYNEINIHQILKGILKFSIIPLFIINEYTFNFLIELIIIPIISLLTLITIYSSYKPEYKSVKKISNFLLAIIGIYIVSFAFFEFLTRLNDMQDIIFWKKMFMELLLICHIPLLLYIQIASYYEQLIIRIKIKSNLTATPIKKMKTFFIIAKHCQIKKDKLEKAIKILSVNKIDSFTTLNTLLRNIENRAQVN